MAVTTEWPLVGRDEELAAIAQALDHGRCGIVVSADAGAGKSRLGREALREAERSGAMTEWVQATRSAAMIPLGAFARLLPEAVRSDQGFSLLRDSAHSLRERAQGRPIVIGVDDAQLLDPASAALVLHLATDAGAFVVATVRVGEPCPDAIVSLWKDAGAQRLKLAGLSDLAVRALVEAALEGPIEEAAMRWILDRSQGNPLYARELVLGAVDAGRLTTADGLWRLAGAPAVAASLVELVGGRIDDLTVEQRAAVELLALSEPLRLPEIERLTSFDALTYAESHGLITIDSNTGPGDVRLAHPLYGDVLRSRLPRLRSRALRLRLATTLQEREPLAPDDALRVVRLLLDAGAPIPTVLLVDAARAANLSGDPELGAELGALAVADGGGLAAALVSARANAMRRHFEEAEAALAAVEADVPGDPSAVPYLEQRIRILFWGLGRVAETHALLDRAATWEPGAEWGRKLLAVRAPTVRAEELPTRVAAMEAALGEENDAETLRLLETRLAINLFYVGRWTQAAALSLRHRPEIPIRDYTALAMMPVYRYTAIESGEDWAGLAADLAQIVGDGVRCHDHEAVAQAAVGLGHLELLRGRFLGAARWLAEAELHFAREDAFGTIADVHLLRIGVAHALKDADTAFESLERVRAIDGGPLPKPLSRRAYFARAEGWATCIRNPARGAAELLTSAEELADAMPGFAAMLAHDALLAGAAPSRVAPLMAELAPRCDGRLPAAYVAHALAAVARDGAALLEVAEAFASIGATRAGMRACEHAAAVFVAAGRQDSARRAATRARELHEPDQGTEPPVLDGVDRTAVALTARESQLVGFARQGLSNAEIADRLVLSVRTVETHLYRAMQKLSISDRRDL